MLAAGGLGAMGGRDFVVLKERLLLQLVREFLEEQGMAEAMRSIETATGLLPLANLSKEVLFLRELVLNGKWAALLEYLSSLESAEGYGRCLFLIRKQEFLELLMQPLSMAESMKEKGNKLRESLQQLQRVCPSKEELSSLMYLLTLPRLQSHPDYKDTTVMGSRLILFSSMVDFLNEHSYPAVSSPGTGDEGQHRLIQLVAKGLLYEQCESVYSMRNGGEELARNKMFDLCSWMQQQPASSFLAPVATVQLKTESSGGCRKDIRIAPKSLKHPPLFTSMFTPAEESGELENDKLSKSAPIAVRSVWEETRELPKRSATGVRAQNTSREVDQAVSEAQAPKPSTPPPPPPPYPSSPPHPQQVPTSVNTSPVTVQSIPTILSVESSTPMCQRRVHTATVMSSPVPYHRGTHDTPHTLRLSATRFNGAQQISPTHPEHWPITTLATTVVDTHVIRCASFSSSGDLLAIGANSRTLRVLSMAPLLATRTNCNELPQLHHCTNYHRGSIYCLAWWKDAILVSGSNDQTVHYLHHPSGQEHVQNMRCTVREVKFMPSGKLLTCGAGENGLTLTDCDKLKVVQSFRGHSGQVLAASVIDEHTFASGGEDRTVKIWDTRSPTLMHSLTVSNVVTSLTNHGDQLAFSTTSGSCHICTLSTGLTLLDNFTPTNKECRSIRFSPCGSWLLTGSYTGTVSLALSSTLECQPLHQHNDKVIQCRWHPSQSLIATTSADKTAQLRRLQW